MIHRRDELRAEKILIDRLLKNEKIVPMWFHEIDEVYGTDMPLGVEGVKVKQTKTGEITDIPCKGVFVAIGHAPANELVKDVLETQHGRICGDPTRQHGNIHLPVCLPPAI